MVFGYFQYAELDGSDLTVFVTGNWPLHRISQPSIPEKFKRHSNLLLQECICFFLFIYWLFIYVLNSS